MLMMTVRKSVVIVRLVVLRGCEKLFEVLNIHNSIIKYHYQLSVHSIYLNDEKKLTVDEQFAVLHHDAKISQVVSQFQA